MRPHTITRVTVTPVAFADPPLLNAAGVHQPYALRSVVQVETDSGLVGLGETYGDRDILDQLRAVGEALVGTSAHDVGLLFRRVGAVVGDRWPRKRVATVVAPFDTALHDIQGQAVDLPVWALLGGKHRDRVDLSGYLFYKWAAHRDGQPDPWGEALDAQQVVAQARRMVDVYGFRSLKLKGGVLPPDTEAEAIEALSAAFPGVPLRIDPNGTWDAATSTRIAHRLEQHLEYLEDPSPGIPAMAEVSATTPLPLATNMCVVEDGHIAEAVRVDAVQVVLADHHYWGGFAATMNLASTCRTLGLRLSMHSNSHLGISLAGMVHLGAAIENLDYALDTHWPWKDPGDDVVDSTHLAIESGSVAVPDRPGLGVTLDPDRLAALHETYLASGIDHRDDGTYIRTYDATFDERLPRWFS